MARYYHSILLLFASCSVILKCCKAEYKFLRGISKETSPKEQQVQQQQQQQELLYSLAQRMMPRNLDLGNSTHSAPHGQFFHLHHMKSGGTSLSNWISCGKSRLSAASTSTSTSRSIPSASLSECSWNSYHRCIENEKDSCRKSIENAAVMNYCSPLAVTNYFNWTEADAVTMMRHPVHRVWSMFRFQTNSCFKCTNLTQVYQDMDNGDIDKYGGGVCLAQLSNHITRNLQKNVHVYDLDSTLPTSLHGINNNNNNNSSSGVNSRSEKERLADAIDSIQNRFAVVGIMERLQESIDMLSFSFPWLSEEMEGSNRVCKFPHANSSPKNNRCGPGGSHWDLPSEPDEETRRAIEEHNQLDMRVYEAALAHFELQKEAMLLAQRMQ